jgi:hypothetical protein
MDIESRKKFKVWQIENEIIVGKFWGEQDEKDAKNFIIEMYELTMPQGIKEKANAIFDKFLKSEGQEITKEFVGEVNKLIGVMDKEIKILIDASEGGKSTSNARSIYVEFAKSFEEGKVAIFGSTTLIRVVASFIVRAAGRGNVRFFATEEESLNWLKEDQNKL